MVLGLEGSYGDGYVLVAEDQACVGAGHFAGRHGGRGAVEGGGGGEAVLGRAAGRGA